MSILFALLTFITWAFGDIFGAIASRKTDGYSTTFWVYVFGFIITSFYLPFSISAFKFLTWPIFFLTMLLGFFQLAGNTMNNEAMKISNPSLIGTITGSTYSGSAVLFSALIFKEHLSSFQILSLILIFIGVILTSINLQSIKKGLFWDKGIKLALLTMFSWTIFAVFIKSIVVKIGWFLPTYFALSLFPLLFIYMKFKKIPLQKPTLGNAMLPILLSSIFLRTGEFTFNLGLKQGSIPIISSIAGAYPALFVLIAFFIFKQKINKQQITGILTTLSGIILLSIVSI